jgi:hypothetical protein
VTVGKTAGVVLHHARARERSGKHAGSFNAELASSVVRGTGQRVYRSSSDSLQISNGDQIAVCNGTDVVLMKSHESLRLSGG